MQAKKLTKKIELSYIDFLKSYILWKKMSLVFCLPKIPIKWNESLINNFQSELLKLSQKNEWLILNKLKTQKWTIVESIEFINNISYLKFINKLNDFDTFCINYELIKSELPLILDWIESNIQKINENIWKWRDIIEVVKYFILNWKSDLFIRELQIKVHTKFIENNKKIIDELLQFVNINEDNIFNFAWDTFEEKYWLKVKPNFIRFRFLDNSLQEDFFSYKIDDIYLKNEDFEKLEINCNEVYIVENEINYLTFPKVQKSIIIWWKWFNITLLKNTKWLNNKQMHYWWDLDSHWFKILSIFRKYFKNTKSLFMDKQTYDKFREYEVEWKVLWNDEVKKYIEYLTTEEFELLNYLNKNKLRLEQENINQEYIITFKK